MRLNEHHELIQGTAMISLARVRHAILRGKPWARKGQIPP